MNPAGGVRSTDQGVAEPSPVGVWADVAEWAVIVLVLLAVVFMPFWND